MAEAEVVAQEAAAEAMNAEGVEVAEASNAEGVKVAEAMNVAVLVRHTFVVSAVGVVAREPDHRRPATRQAHAVHRSSVPALFLTDPAPVVSSESARIGCA